MMNGVGEYSGSATGPSGDPVVDAALAELARLDRNLAEAAEAGFTSLTWGEGLSAVTAHGLADFLWYRLPTKWIGSIETKRQIAAALATLFQRINRPRYAAMCSQTADVLAAYEKGVTAGWRAYRTALVATGTEPPDLPGRFRWGARMGIEEASAYWSVSVTLERAIDEGRLRPGRPGWRKTAAAITRAFLDGPHDDLTSATWQQWIETERLQGWLEDSHGGEHRRLAESVVNHLIHPPALPETAPQHLAPVQWLLEHAAAGAALTENGNLVRNLAGEACRRFHWYPREPRSEQDVYELVALRKLIQQMGLVRRCGRRLVLSAAGKAAHAADLAELWQLTMENLLGGEPAEMAAGEAALLLLAGGEAYSYSELDSAVAEILAEQGWRDESTHAPVTHDMAARLLSTLLGRFEALGLSAESIFGAPLQLSAAGRAAAVVALRARALRPRTVDFGLEAGW